MSFGQVIFGGSVSLTVTVNEQEDLLPPASVTSKVFVVGPMGKVEPLGRPAVWVVVAPGHSSVPTGAVYVTFAPQTPGSLLTVISAGHVMVGGEFKVAASSFVTKPSKPPPPYVPWKGFASGKSVLLVW